MKRRFVASLRPLRFGSGRKRLERRKTAHAWASGFSSSDVGDGRQLGRSLAVLAVVTKDQRDRARRGVCAELSAERHADPVDTVEVLDDQVRPLAPCDLEGLVVGIAGQQPDVGLIQERAAQRGFRGVLGDDEDGVTRAAPEVLEHIREDGVAMGAGQGEPCGGSRLAAVSIIDRR